MNRFIILALTLAFALPPASNAIIVPLIPTNLAYNPRAVCNAIQTLKHDVCNSVDAVDDNAHNNSIALLCRALSELNSTLCIDSVSSTTYKPFTNIPIKTLCPLLDFVNTELCSNSTEVAQSNHGNHGNHGKLGVVAAVADGGTPSLILAHARPSHVDAFEEVCPIIKLFDEELCGHLQERY